MRGIAGGKRFQLEIQTKEDPQKMLSELQGVSSLQIKSRTEDVYQIELFSERELRGDVAEIARTRNWAIRTLSLRQPSIEEVFLNVIGEEQ